MQAHLNVLVGLHAEYISETAAYGDIYLKWKDRNTGEYFITQIHTEDFAANAAPDNFELGQIQ